MKTYGGMEESVPTSPVDMYNDTCKRIDKILNYHDQFKASWDHGAETLISAYHIMRNGIDKSIRNENISLTNEEIRTVKRASDVLYDKCLFGILEDISRDFIFEVLKLLNNWNLNCYKNEEFGTRIKATDRIFRMELTMLEMMEVNRQIIEKMKQIISYVPPSFEHSRAYLQTFCDKCD